MFQSRDQWLRWHGESGQWEQNSTPGGISYLPTWPSFLCFLVRLKVVTICGFARKWPVFSSSVHQPNARTVCNLSLLLTKLIALSQIGSFGTLSYRVALENSSVQILWCVTSSVAYGGKHISLSLVQNPGCSHIRQFLLKTPPYAWRSEYMTYIFHLLNIVSFIAIEVIECNPACM